MICLSFEERAKSIGITIPQAAAPLGAYVLTVGGGTLLFTAGQGSVKDGVPVFNGKVGRDLALNFRGRERVSVEYFRRSRTCPLLQALS